MYISSIRGWKDEMTAVSERVSLNAYIHVQTSAKNGGSFCLLTMLHSRITQNNSVHNGRNASSLPVDGVNFEVKGTLSIQSGQGKCRFVQGEIVENSSALSWTGLVRLEEERLRKPAVKAWLTSYLHWCTCSIYYATVLNGLRHIWKKGKFNIYENRIQWMNEYIYCKTCRSNVSQDKSGEYILQQQQLVLIHNVWWWCCWRQCHCFHEAL